MMLPGPLLTRWTIRLALACYIAFLAGELTAKRPRSKTFRLVWALGCVLFTLHVACAFHFYHHWSHTAAWQHTAQRTAAIIGYPFGDGIYFSYAFLALWWIDVLWLVVSQSGMSNPAVSNLAVSKLGAVDSAALTSASVAESNVPPSTAPSSATAVPTISAGGKVIRGWRLALHVFLFFIAFNGAIVFESGPTRYAGIAACVLVGGLALHSAKWRAMFHAGPT
jgi:hypothetical protein